MSNDHANSRIAAARKEAYDEGRADILAKVEQVRKWVNDEIHRNDGGDIDEDEWSDGYTAAVEAVLSELNTHFPKAKE